MSDSPENNVHSETSVLKQKLSAGEVLTRARVAQNMTVEELAAQLKLSPVVIQGLESGDMTNLPPRSFIQGYIRACAKALELEPDAVLALWEAEFPKTPDTPFTVTDADKRILRMQRRGHRRVKKRKSRHWVLVFGVSLLVLLGGGFYAKSLLTKSGALTQLIPALSEQASHPLNLTVKKLKRMGNKK